MAKVVFRRYSTKEIYEQQKEAGNIPDGAIFFIFDTKQIGNRKGDSYLLISSESSENLEERVIFLENLTKEMQIDLSDLYRELGFVDGKYVPVNKDLIDKTVSGALDFLADEKYRSEMPDDAQVLTKIGGLEVGITAKELKKQSISQVLDSILFQELQPTITTPTASIGFINGFINKGVYEVGATAPLLSNFTTAFNRGLSKVEGKPDLYRAGKLIDDDQTFIFYGGNTSNKTLPTSIILGKMSYNYQAHHEKGDTLITSNNNTAKVRPNPLPEGVIKSSAITIEGTYPYFCNGVTASTTTRETTFPTEAIEAKLPLISWSAGLIGAKFASEAATETRLTFDYPSLKKITKVEYYNTVFRRWDVFEGYTTSILGNKVIQGNEMSYDRLTTTSDLLGSLQLRFTLSNK